MFDATSRATAPLPETAALRVEVQTEAATVLFIGSSQTYFCAERK